MSAATMPAARQSIETSHILQGLKSREFKLVYQPQVDAHNGRLLGFESLMRWHSPKFGQVPPDIFITTAESGGIVQSIWDYLLEEVIADRKQLNEPDGPSVHIALNLSASQLIDSKLSHRIENWLHKHHLDSKQFHIEITESALLADSPVVMDNLRHLHELGIPLWLDDFGTGYSSLKHLVELPIRGLKIDKSFISTIEHNIAHFRLVSTIITMAGSLGLKTVAEGVETEDQSQILTQLGCDCFQGYLIGHPDQMGNLLASWMPDVRANHEKH